MVALLGLSSHIHKQISAVPNLHFAQKLWEQARRKQKEVSDVAMDFSLSLEGIGVQTNVALHEHVGDGIERTASSVSNGKEVVVVEEFNQHVGHIDLDVVVAHAEAVHQRSVDSLSKIHPNGMFAVYLSFHHFVPRPTSYYGRRT